ncbi:MAG: 2,3-bisphosphoglycerate-independent phosphoglycerate mutase [Solirubrobacteraceae bacterium]
MSLPVPAVCLVVLDGWGLAPDGPGNAISLADTPVFDDLWARYPHTELNATGTAVGLPEGQMGNSEVGHLNLGAGSVVKQDLTRIDEAVHDGSINRNEVLVEAFSNAERVHLIGLVSDGGVHSGWEHLRALIEMGGQLGAPDVVVHAFTDGRDASPTGGAGYLEAVEGWCRGAGNARVGSVVGRYFAMDRDKRWDRTQRAYDLIVHGEAPFAADTGVEAVKQAYGRDETDEFVSPTLVGGEARVRDQDSIVCFNFRPDRMRQIVRALAEPQSEFRKIDRGGRAPFERLVTMASYEEDWTYPVAFPPKRPGATLPAVLSERGVHQLHVAETEKYAHVTYFFNGGVEEPQEGEDRELVPSPRDVPTYDHKPEMSAREAAETFVRHWQDNGYGFGIINFANPDMVGHTGVIEAAVTAVETVDACLGEVVEAVQGSGGACLITADHGNCDHMLNEDGSPSTAHSVNPVPLIVTVEALALRGGGVLADVAPTVLALLGQEQPAGMTGTPLIA